MPESEKQEGQKTVVAFIAGLLIGGLLVWVFSSSPEDKEVTSETEQTGSTVVSDTSRTTNTRTTSQTQSAAVTNTVEPDIIRDGLIEVADQPAGFSVSLTSVLFPTTEGWVAVRELMDGIPGNILGAARYNEDVGLVPDTVRLLRKTEPGSVYEVVFFTENGDLVFDLTDDLEISGVSDTFTAEAEAMNDEMLLEGDASMEAASTEEESSETTTE